MELPPNRTLEDDPPAHPLVATRALLEGRVQPLPSPAGRREPTGALSRRTLDTTMAIAEAVFTPDGKPLPADRLRWLCEEYADFMARAQPNGRLLFTLAAAVISIVAPLLILRLPPFRRLPLDVRIRALQRLETRPLGALLIAIRAIICLIYYEHPDPAREVGIEIVGPPGGRLVEEGP